MTLQGTARTRRDRWADWAVVGVVVVALLLGWAVKAWAEGSTEQFSDAETALTLNYPTGWLAGSDEDFLFRARDPQSGLFKTTYRVAAQALDPARPLSLVDAVNMTSVSRARKLTAFRLLDIEPVGPEAESPRAIWSRYAYVEEKPDPFRETLPVVVLGLDYTGVKDDHLFTLTLLASEANFEEAEAAFKAFVRDAGFEG
jgi:hypothetical protein